MNNIYQSFVNGQHGIGDVSWKLREDFQPLKDQTKYKQRNKRRAWGEGRERDRERVQTELACGGLWNVKSVVRTSEIVTLLNALKKEKSKPINPDLT